MADEDRGTAIAPWQAATWPATPDSMCMDCGAACEAGTEALYRVYSDPLLRFVRRCGAKRRLAESQLDAEGVVQETFVEILRYQGPIAYPPAWLYAVARRKVARIYAAERRNAHRDPERVIDGANAHLQWTSLAPSAPVEHVIATRAVMDAIARLPDRQRAATYFRHVEGWSLSEIGSYLSCTSATAGVHVHRGTRTISQGGRPAYGSSSPIYMYPDLPSQYGLPSPYGLPSWDSTPRWRVVLRNWRRACPRRAAHPRDLLLAIHALIATRRR